MAYGTHSSAAGWENRPAGTPATTGALPAVGGTLAGSALWLLSSNVLYQASQWGAVVALAKLGAPAALGHLGLALAVATPAVQMSSFGLRAYQATDVLRRYAFAEYLNLRLLANVVVAVVIGAVAAAGLVESTAVAILIPIGLAKLVEATSENCYGLLQRHDRMRFVAVSRVVRGALGLVALVTVVALGGTLAAGAWALAGAWAAFLLAVDLPAAGALEPMLAWPRAARLWRLARESAPLGAVSGVFALSQSVPRYVLATTQGAAAVGYFTALAAVVPAVAQLSTAVCHAAAPRLGWRAVQDVRRFRNLVVQLLGAAAAASLLLVLGAVLGGRTFLTLAYAPDYAAHQTTFVLVVVAGGLAVVNEVLQFALLAVRRMAAQLAVQCLGLVTTVVVGVLLIPHLGLPGAGIAALLSGGAMAIASTGLVLGRRGAP